MEVMALNSTLLLSPPLIIQGSCSESKAFALLQGLTLGSHPLAHSGATGFWGPAQGHHSGGSEGSASHFPTQLNAAALDG